MKKMRNFTKKVTSCFRWLFFIIFKTLLYPYVIIVQNVRFKKNGFKIPKGPCLFLSNHACNWDGIWLELMFYGRVIHFIVNEVLFRNAILNFIMHKILGMVKRGEGGNDLTSVKNILELKKKGKNIGIYPEGDIDMWGRSLPIDDGITKLAKKLNMPIVLLRVDGANLRACRWGHLPRRSKITYNITDVLTVEKIKELSLPELHEKVINGIKYDEAKYQEKANIHISFPWGRAEHIEYGLFWCPKCGALHSLYSSNNSVYCANCELVAYLDSTYHFKSDFENIPSNPSEWADRQMEFIPHYVDTILDDKPVLMSKRIRLSLAPRRHFFGRRYTVGVLKLFKDRIEHVDRDGYKTVVTLSQADRILLQEKDKLEIHTDLVKLRFFRPERLWSAYSWVVISNYLREKQN